MSQQFYGSETYPRGKAKSFSTWGRIDRKKASGGLGGTIVDATVIELAYKLPQRGTKSCRLWAGWAKKRRRHIYGYNAHFYPTKQDLIRKTKATSDELYDGSGLTPVLDGREAKVYADKAYNSKKNHRLLKNHGIKDSLLHKKQKGKRLEESLKVLNKINTQIRATIERTFAYLKHS